MKAFLLFVFILFSGCQSPGDLEQNHPVDLGQMFFADIEDKTAAGQRVVEITFNRDLSEVVNGVVHHGFAWSTIEVENPTLNGIPLKQTWVDSNGRHYPKYSSEIKSPPAMYHLTFSLDGKSYESNDSERENRKDVIRIPMTTNQLP